MKASIERLVFSIIVCSHRQGRAEFIRQHYEALFRDQTFEFILIPDAKSLCEGYTRGLHQSTGRYLIFSHDDIEFVIGGVAPLLRQHLAQYDIVGIAGTTKLIDGEWISAGDPNCFGLVIYPEGVGQFVVKCFGGGDLSVPNVQALDGCFLACRREVAESIGFDAITFDGFHLYDVDFTFGAYLKGFRLAVCRDLALIHASMGTNADGAWAEYQKRFEAKYRGRLSDGSRGHVRELRARLPREKLAWFCEPKELRELIKKLD